MSYTVPANFGRSVPRARPGTVTWSAVLLFAVAAIHLIDAAMDVAAFRAFAGEYRESFGDDLDAGRYLVGPVLINAVFAVLFTVLAFTNLRGFNASRIVTWVVAPIALCCAGTNLFATGISGMVTDSVLESLEETDPLGAEYIRQLAAAQPDWYAPVMIVLPALTIAALIVVIILLALPASNAYFNSPRRARPEPAYPPVQ